jgi:glycosyltransferase involved in cell wall biosynthesis
MPDHKALRVSFLAGTLGRGGAERQLIYMLNALKAAGIAVRVLCLTRGEAFEQEIQMMGIQVTWVGKSRWRPIRLLRIMRELRRNPTDILQSAHFYTNLYVAVAGRLLGIPAIGAIRNDLTSELSGNGILGWGQLHLPKQLIANSRLAAERALAQGIPSECIQVVANVVNGNDGQGERVASRDDVTRILFAGRLTEQKRVDRFLRAIQEITRSHPHLNFTAAIAGDGPLRARLEAQADSLGLRPGRVEFLGEVADLQSSYERADLLVLTSDWEGTPNVLLEAMSYRLPIVATRAGGVPDLVLDGVNGFLVEKDDTDSLAKSIITLIQSPQLRSELGAAGQRLVRERHWPGKLAENLMTVYNRALGGAAKASEISAEARDREIRPKTLCTDLDVEVL